MDTGFGSLQLYSACRVEAAHHFKVGGSHCIDLEGSGFLVEFPENDSRLALVTNRHIADAVFYDEDLNDGSSLTSVRVQWWQSKALRLEHTIVNPRPLYNVDPLIDVAVIPIASTPDARIEIVGELFGDLDQFVDENSAEEFAFEHAISWENLSECESLWSQLEPGEFVVFPGYPVWHDHLQIRPVMRSGLIASDPQTDYRSTSGVRTKKDSSHQVLFDAYSTSGNSGSPVYVAQRGLPPADLPFTFADGSPGLRFQLGFHRYRRSFLVGINASHYNDTGILHHNEHAGLSRMHKLSVIMDILRANRGTYGPESRQLKVSIPVPDGAKRNAKKRAKAARDKVIVALHQQGTSYRAIAAEVGCSTSTVGKVVRQHTGGRIHKE
ncbi:helix-turn-helix domain-containing protein [Mycolicibacterium mengxianglii]|uniref:helix-turn-helix domain-containing protein n=1 Tax=Mycolicibacterium mengxianglii TaxID=2736649 RepID=UPI0018EF2207|nr:helix-turn-helix domain-containing protein [Mycolicibacterium mengxianglii]